MSKTVEEVLSVHKKLCECGCGQEIKQPFTRYWKGHSPNKPIFCECGCGELIPSVNKWRSSVRFKNGHARRGHGLRMEQNPRWKGGRRKQADGYIQIRCKERPYSNGGYVLEHRLVMEKQLGRYLLSSEDVHHINHDKADNRLENLKLLSRAEHRRHHVIDMS